MPDLYPSYEARRSEMEAAMRLRLDVIEDLLHERLGLADTAPINDAVMKEFDVVLTQMPYVGGVESRMSDLFMRLLGFMAIGRVLHRRGLSKEVIAGLELESFKRHMLTIPEADRLEAGRQFVSDATRLSSATKSGEPRTEVSRRLRLRLCRPQPE